MRILFAMGLIFHNKSAIHSFKLYTSCQKYIPIQIHGEGVSLFFGWAYHNESDSLAQCPTGLEMVPLPCFATRRPDFITNPGAQILS